MFATPFAVALLAAAPSTEGGLTAPVTDSYGVVSSTAQIGTLKVSSHGNEAEIDFRIDDNGRGPKIKEKLKFDDKGQLVRREIEGKGETGAPIKETFSIENGKARWETLDDRGEADAKDALYLDHGGSPWTLA